MTLKERAYRWLRWSERYTKTDMVYVGKSGFWLMSNQVVGVVVSLLLSILFANFVSKEVFGMYRYVIATAGILAAFSLTGINAAIVRAVAQGFDKIFKPAVTQQLIWSIPRFFIGFGFSVYYFFQSHPVYGFAFLIVSILSPLASIANTYGPYLEGKLQFHANSVYSIWVNIVHFTFLAFVSVYTPSVIFLVLAYYGSSLLTQSFFLWRTFKKYPQTGKEVRDEDVQYAKNLSVMNIFNTIATHIDSIIVYHLLGPVQLALYTFALLIPERIRMIFGVIASAALPKLSQKQARGRKVTLLPKLLVLIVLAFPIIVVYTLIAPYIFSVLFPEYMDSIMYSQIYAISLFAIASNISVPALFAEKKQKELYILNIMTPTIKILLSLAGVFLYGIWGAIFAKIFHQFSYLFISSFLALRKQIM